MRKYKRTQPTLKDPIRICIVCTAVYTAVAPMQKTCSRECRRKIAAEKTTAFKRNNPDADRIYAENRKKKHPDLWKERNQRERKQIIDVLGGKCKVNECPVTNTKWLHIDYIPAMRGTGMRHPRHKKWVMDNISAFRLLCANHHYELTLTGKIEGSDITQ